MVIREKIEKFENLTLVPQAVLSQRSKGRKVFEEKYTMDGSKNLFNDVVKMLNL